MLEPFVYEWTSSKNGSISAEHGVGLAKANMMHYSKSTEAINIMRRLKQLFDPNGILNPYKVIFPLPMPQMARLTLVPLGSPRLMRLEVRS